MQRLQSPAWNATLAAAFATTCSPCSRKWAAAWARATVRSPAKAASSSRCAVMMPTADFDGDYAAVPAAAASNRPIRAAA